MVARRRRLLVVGAGVAVLLLFVLFRPGAETAPKAPARLGDGPQPTSVTPGDPARVGPAPTGLKLPPTPAGGSEAPAIPLVRRRLVTTLVATPPSPCVDEETLVEARLEPGSEGAKVAIEGEPRTRAILVFQQAGPQVVHALADDWKAGWDEASLTLDVRPCAAPVRVVVALELTGGSELLARASLPASVGAVQRWEWDFGDGTSTSTPGPVATHSYALRPQRLPQETVLVEARAILVGGGERSGRAALALLNEHLLTGLGDTLFLPVVHERYPRRDGDSIHSTLQVRNLTDRPVHLDTATMRATPCARGAPTTEIEIAAKQLLSDTTLAADAVTSLALTLDARSLEGVCGVQVRVNGGADERPVQLLFSLELGTPESATRVDDVALVQKILAAQQILGRSQVSIEEVQRLDAEGKLP